ncbi:MAG: choice-of-anchor B family protein [bacterium]|nr:choice-of-anchor B family protein [bacterium]
MHQRSVIKLCLLLASLTALAATAIAVPFPYPDEVPMGQPQPTKSTLKPPPAPAATDTTHLFCSIGAVSLGGLGNDCWGWAAPDGTEYAIAGNGPGIAFINTEILQIVDVIPYAENCTWKDIKTYQDYAYAVSECGGSNQGLLIMDMSTLPDSVHLIGSMPINNSGGVTSHNLWIDTAAGYLYTEGSPATDYAIHIFSLANPAAPNYINSFGPSSGIHDLYVRNDTAYLAEGWDPSFSIWDLSNKFSPQLLTRVTVPTGGYVHNIWPTDDGKYCVTTEETGFHTVKIWDIQDIGNVQLLGEYLAPSNLAHNAQVTGNDRVHISHYESGVVVLDISDPNFPVEIGRYDTYPADESANFNGCWGVYQYTPSGKVYASNMDGTLHILEEQAAVLDDTMYVEHVQATPGGDVRVDVHAVNNLPMRQFIIPFDWNGPYNLTLDSVSTAGLRTEYFEDQIFNGQNFANKKASYRLTSSNFGSSPDLPVGSGPILSLWFSVPFGVSGGPNPVILTPYNDKIPLFVYHCLIYEPATVDGSVGLSCCVGITGNIDGDPFQTIDVTDLTYFVDYLFAGGAAPACPDEANINGDITKAVDIGDLTYFVEFLFGGGPFPAMCQ